ncbi:MAG TPA: peptidylprolyl isomerase [Polyangiaceae bacterium]|nr:peptidylprolyl isomerase [Polyangiaceae bacterium]
MTARKCVRVSRLGLSRLGRTLAAALLLAGALSAARDARAVTVEKIVAIVGDDAILQSDLRARGAPFLRQISRQFPPGPQRAAAESQMYKELVDKIVEETLEAQAAERAKLVVAPDELDKAFDQLAAGQHMTVDQLFEVTEQKTGMTETEYRGEIRRQILEGKILSQRVRGRIRITEEDLKNAYKRSVREERERRQYRPAWIALRILPSSTPEAIQEREALAAEIHKQLEQGADFGELAAKYSDDTKSRDKGGDLGIKAPIKSPAAQTGRRPALSAELEEKVMPLEPDDYTEPFRAGDAIVIVKLLSREPSHFTTFEAAREEMVARVQNEILAREKAAFIDELKKRTYVKVSL